MDEKIYQERDPRFRSKGFEVRKILTLAGEVSLKRRSYIDTYTQTRIVLADCHLNVPALVKLSPQVVRVISNFACDTSYRSAADALSVYTGYTISPKSVKTALETSAQAIKQAEANTSGTKREVSKLYCEADGTYLALQQRFIDKTKRSKKSLEIGVATYYSQKSNADKDRQVLTDASWLALWHRVKKRVGQSYDTDKIHTTYLGTDGATNCQMGQDYLPGSVTLSYDIWHVFHAISTFVGQDMGTYLIKVLKRQGFEAALQAIDDHKYGDDEVFIDNLDKLSQYLLRHQSTIRAGLENNLGSIESINAHVVGSRMKRYGGAWSLSGIDAMLTCRAWRASGNSTPVAGKDVGKTLQEHLLGRSNISVRAQVAQIVRELPKDRCDYTRQKPTGIRPYYRQATIPDSELRSRIGRVLGI
jgi:hypothetical protein